VQIDSTLQTIAIAPGDAGYAEASTTYMGQGEPTVILRARDAADVAAALRLATREDAVLSVRSGGHSGPGFGTNTGGVVLDLSGIDDVDVIDADAGVVRIGTGATWGAVAEALAEHGLALTSGDTRSVGVGGLTLGGGMGWMVRKYGLTIDSLRAVDLVTGDGTPLRASADEHPDLFWALRGGGGNFGVVTHFEFVAQRVSRVVAGMITYEAGDTATLVAGWRDAMRAAPDELSTAILLLPGFGEFPAGVSVFVCWAGPDDDEAQAAIAPLLKIGAVATSTVEEQPYADVLEEAHPPPGVRAVVGNTLVRSLDNEAIESMAAAYADGKAGRVIFVRSLGGAMARVAPDATAFAHRDVEAMIVSAVFVPLDASDEVVAAAGESWLPIAAHGCGAYGNFLGSATADDVAAMYPPATYERLALIKREYDPANLFSQNHNIPPA
jgi:FAD/FMN-containing dehydrogenase